jgi:N-acetyl-anhydromuramyl-L-alanine amidase AmpD
MAYPIKDIRRTIPRHKTKVPKKRVNADTIIVHTIASDNQDPNKTALYHVTPSKDNHISKTGCPTVAYADFITKDGTLYHCVDYTSVTWHAGLYNTRSLAVVLAYRGQDSGVSPTELQMQTLEEHLTFLCLYLHISPVNILGHREIPGMFILLGNGSKRYRKECPGMMINLDQLRYDVTCRVQRRLAALNLYNKEIDGKWGPASKVALKAFIPKEKMDWVYKD